MIHAVKVYDGQVVRLPNLRALRTRQALSQDELARHARISRGTLLRIEAQVQEPRPATIRRLAKALGVKPTDLMGPVES
jgi:transcriptional regulator with XRE-family HTH domain